MKVLIIAVLSISSLSYARTGDVVLDSDILRQSEHLDQMLRVPSSIDSPEGKFHKNQKTFKWKEGTSSEKFERRHRHREQQNEN